MIRLLLKKGEWPPSQSSHSPTQLQQMKNHLLYILMIIDFTHSFKDYNEILEFYGIWEYTCPKCGAKHSFHRHAKYFRNLIVWHDDGLTQEHLEILRLQCGSCGSTHAILTADVIPFSVFSVEAFLTLLSFCLTRNGSVLQAEKKTGVSYQLLYRFLQIFYEYRGKLILFLRRETLWCLAGHPAAGELLQLLLSHPPPRLTCRFFSCFQTPLFLHRRSTVSYPLTFHGGSMQIQPPT